MLAGVSGDRIGQWARWGHIRSSRSEREPRVYSYEDVAEAMIVHELEELGADLPSIRSAVERLRERQHVGWPLQHNRAPAGRRATARSWSSRATRPTTSARAARASRASWRRRTCTASPPSSSAAAGPRASSPACATSRSIPDRLGGRPVIRGRRIAAQDVATLVAEPGGRVLLHDDYDLDDAQIDDAVSWWATARDLRALMAGRLLHLDENLPLRLAAELEARGRPARAHRALPDAPTTDTGAHPLARRRRGPRHGGRGHAARAPRAAARAPRDGRGRARRRRGRQARDGAPLGARDGDAAAGIGPALLPATTRLAR